MKFCDAHWTAMRAAVDARGLTPFIAKDGAVAIQQMVKTVEQGDGSKATYDPLMSMHWSIATNVMGFLGQNAMYLLSGGPDDPDDPVDGYPGYEGRTWSRCPLCYINLAHEVSCTDPKCGLDKQAGYDWTIDRAADDALVKAREYGLVP